MARIERKVDDNAKQTLHDKKVVPKHTRQKRANRG